MACCGVKRARWRSRHAYMPSIISIWSVNASPKSATVTVSGWLGPALPACWHLPSRASARHAGAGALPASFALPPAPRARSEARERLGAFARPEPAPQQPGPPEPGRSAWIQRLAWSELVHLVAPAPGSADCDPAVLDPAAARARHSAFVPTPGIARTGHPTPLCPWLRSVAGQQAALMRDR